MHDAISYKRFSSGKQAAGDSVRRQTDLTREYCKRHHLRLIDTYLDAGLSGFTGENLTDGGALRALLNAASAGRFAPGTRLIVESLDRLSRREISTAVRLFLDLLDTGLVIITLVDGEQVFTKERVDTDLTALIIVIVFLSRANNESRVRRERALQAQQTARHKARKHKIPITAECPYWLKLEGTGATRHFVVNTERAKVIEYIFKAIVAGKGQLQITKVLNDRAVPTFAGKPKWRAGMIGHLLKSRSVTGIFQPCLSLVENGRRRRVPDPDGPILDYFPAIISQELYQQARGAARSRDTRRERPKHPAYCNLAVRLGRCASCGGNLHHSGSAGGWSYLRCENARHRCANNLGFSYRHLEAVLFALDDLTEFVHGIVSRREADSMKLQRAKRRHGPEPDAIRVRVAERESALARLKAAKVLARSTELDHRKNGRRAMISELRLLIEAIVLHADRTLTVHLQPDVDGYRAVLVLDRTLRGIQVKAAYGTTGLIEGSVVAGMVRPVKAICRTSPAAEDVWQPCKLDELLRRVQVIDTAQGDWQVIAPDPMRVAQIVGAAEDSIRQSP